MKPKPLSTPLQETAPSRRKPVFPLEKHLSIAETFDRNFKLGGQLFLDEIKKSEDIGCGINSQQKVAQAIQHVLQAKKEPYEKRRINENKKTRWGIKGVSFRDPLKLKTFTQATQDAQTAQATQSFANNVPITADLTKNIPDKRVSNVLSDMC